MHIQVKLAMFKMISIAFTNVFLRVSTCQPSKHLCEIRLRNRDWWHSREITLQMDL